MDLIILAAGRNERLKGVVPAFMKPLLLVDGQPLIARIVAEARPRIGPGATIVVASPQNADALTQVVPILDDCLFIVQPTPSGVVNAARLGLRLATSRHAVLVCADNLIEPSAWSAPPFDGSVSTDDAQLFVHGRALPRAQALRLTYYSKQHACWYEKRPPPDNEHEVFCWLGPLAFDVAAMRACLARNPEMTQQLGPLFDDYEPGTVCVTSMSRDLGTLDDVRSAP